MRLPLLPLLTVIASLALAACHGGTTISGPYTLTFHRTGGLLGLQETIVIDSAARTIVRSYATASSPTPVVQPATLTDADVATVTAAVEAADLEHAGGPYACKACSDTMSYEAALVVGGATYDALWTDDSDASLEALGSTLGVLDENKFPSGP